MKSSLNWFEIPVADIDRAARFYEQVLAVKLKREEFGGERIAVFPAVDPGVTGALMQGPRRKPSGEGTLIFLDAPELEDSLVRASTAGGKIALPLTDIGEMGQMAIVIDSEGNRVGLHRARS